MQVLEKILEEIDEAIARYGENPYIDEKVTDLCYGLNLAKDIVRKHMNDDWIPVEDRLPEDTDEDYYQSVIVTLLDGRVAPGVYREQDEEWWVEDEEGIKEYTLNQDVIAWCPMPEPYRPERSDGK